MDRKLSTAAITQKEADERLDRLHQQFPDFEFTAESKESGRFEFTLKNVGANIDTPKMDQMKRYANGFIGSTEADPNDPRTSGGTGNI